jgi:hypothetical protein
MRKATEWKMLPRFFKCTPAGVPRFFKGTPAGVPRFFKGPPAGVPRFFKGTPAGVPRIPASPGDAGEAIGAALLTKSRSKTSSTVLFFFAFSKAVESRNLYISSSTVIHKKERQQFARVHRAILLPGATRVKHALASGQQNSDAKH